MRMVLFVCTGNSCRSVMGKAICEQMLRERGIYGGDPNNTTDPAKKIYVMSAGVMASEGMTATFETRTVLRNAGMDISGHRAMKLVDQMIRHAELILVMEEMHYDDIVRRVPEAAAKTFMLKTFGLEPSATALIQDPTILDPIGKPLHVYETCFAEIKEGVERVIKYLETHVTKV